MSKTTNMNKCGWLQVSEKEFDTYQDEDFGMVIERPLTLAEALDSFGFYVTSEEAIGRTLEAVIEVPTNRRGYDHLRVEMDADDYREFADMAWRFDEYSTDWFNALYDSATVMFK